MNAHTKQQQDKVFETDFIDSQKPDPPFAHLLALSGINASKSLGQNYASAFNRFTVSSVAKFCDSEQRFARKEQKNSISAMLAAAPSL